MDWSFSNLFWQVGQWYSYKGISYSSCSTRFGLAWGQNYNRGSLPQRQQVAVKFNPAEYGRQVTPLQIQGNRILIFESSSSTNTFILSLLPIILSLSKDCTPLPLILSLSKDGLSTTSVG